MSYHRAIYEGRVINNNGELCLEYIARPAYSSTYNKVKNTKKAVYRKTEKGVILFNCIDFDYNGYKVDFDAENEWFEAYSSFKGNGPYISDLVTKFDLAPIFDKYPKFKYIWDEIPHDFSLVGLFNLLCFWIAHPECEYPIKMGYHRIATDKRFYKLTKSKFKDVFSFMKRLLSLKRDVSFISLNDICSVLKDKNNVDLSLFYEWCLLKNDTYFNKAINKEANNNYHLYAYYINKKLLYDNLSYSGFLRYYDDYITMCKTANKNLNDNYWRYPKNFNAMHNKMMIEAQEIEKALEEQEKMSFAERMQKYQCLNCDVNGYFIYIADNLEDWKLQAEKLHQCILEARYDKQVLDRRCLIVFIRKDNEPVATCQLYKDYSIGQFYANELDRQNCLPAEDVKTAMNIWIKQSKSRMKEICCC